jgi:hypothetical protein
MIAALTDLWQHLQRQLFPALTEELGPLSPLDEQFVQTISLTDLTPFLRQYEWIGNGCPPHARVWLIHAFLAKSVYQFPTTAALLDALRTRPLLRQLCGWESVGDIPSESTFSRAFAAFAEDQVPQQIHERMVGTHAGPKLVGHVSRDATAIEAHERPTKPAPAVRPAAARPGKPCAPALRAGPQLHARSAKTWPTCRAPATWAPSATAKATRPVGPATNCTWTPSTATCR